MIPALIVWLVIAFAVIPYGGVSLWAQSLTATLALFFFAYTVAKASNQPAVSIRSSSYGRRIASLLMLLCGWILLHSFARWTGVIHVPETGYLFALLSKSFFWIGAGALAWSVLTLCSSRRSLKTLVLSIVVIGTGEAFLGISALYAGGEGPLQHFVKGARAVGTFSSGNSLGGFIALSLIVTLGAMLRYVDSAVRHIRHRGFRMLHASTREDFCIILAAAFIVAALTQSSALFLSGSRGAMVSAVAGVIPLIFLYTSGKSERSSNRHALPTTLILVALLLMLGAGGSFAIVTQRFSALAAPKEAALPRLEIWKGTLDLVRAYPLGVGLGSFSGAFPQFRPEGFALSRTYHAHNDYLEVLAELGIPGMVLVVALLVSLLTLAARRALQAESGRSTWFRCCALCALSAGLTHAFVDFNLSSRPGVSMLFMVLLGIALSKRSSSTTRSQSFSIKQIINVKFVLLLGGILAITIFNIGAARANIMTQQAFAAAGGEPSVYHFLPAWPLTPEAAISRLQKASRLMPIYPSPLFHLGRARRLLFDQKINKLVQNSINDKTTVSTDFVRRQISLALRRDERDMLQKCISDFDRTLRIAPDNIDALAHQADAIGRLAHLATSLDEFSSHANSLLERIGRLRHLAPNDWTICQLLFSSLTQAALSQYANDYSSYSRLHSSLLHQGLELMELRSREAKKVIAVFQQANIEPISLLDSEVLPPGIIKYIYQYYSHQGESDNALEALNALENPHYRDQLESSYHPRKQSEQIEQELDRFVIRERCRWWLRIQKFSKYVESKPERNCTLAELSSNKPDTNDSMATRTRNSLMEAQLLASDRNNEEARNLLLSLLDTAGKDPDVAILLLKNATGLGLNEQDRSRALAKLKTIAPDTFIGMQFMEGHVELTGISVNPSELTSYWRFWSTVPSDLCITIYFRGADNKTTYSMSIDFSKACTLDFGSGNPIIGKIFEIKTPLPSQHINSASKLMIGLRRRSSNQWQYSSEGLPYCEIYNWFDLVYSLDSLRDQAAPSISSQNGFGIASLYKRPHFSHNLKRIYQSDKEFYPLLEGNRKITSPPTWQPCLSAPGLIEHATKAARDTFDTNPYLTMFALGVNDGQDWCQCDECRALCPPEEQDTPPSQRWWSKPYWAFVRDVALEIQKSHPGKRIGAIAYSNVAEPPSYSLPSNVTVYVCLDIAAHFDAGEEEREQGRLRAWMDVCSDVGLYTYAGLASWIFPRYCRDELAKGIKAASELGVARFYIEKNWVKWIDGPLPWIVKRLLEDPDQNPEELQQEFCKTAYGPAWEAMKTYFNYLQEIWHSASYGKWFDGLYRIDEQARRYPPEVLKTMRAYLSDATHLAQGNGAVLRRIGAVADPLSVAERFADEYVLMQALKAPIRDIENITQMQALLGDLKKMINARNDYLAIIDNQPCAPDIKRALSSSRIETTLDRWNRMENGIIKDVDNTLTVLGKLIQGIDNASQDK